MLETDEDFFYEDYLKRICSLQDNIIRISLGHLHAIMDNVENLPASSLQNIAKSGVKSSDALIVEMSDFMLQYGKIDNPDAVNGIRRMRDETLKRNIPESI